MLEYRIMELAAGLGESFRTEGVQLGRDLLELAEALGDGVALSKLVNNCRCWFAELLGEHQCRHIPAWSSFCYSREVSRDLSKSGASG